MKKLKFLTIAIVGLLCLLIQINIDRSEDPIQISQSLGIPRNAPCIQMFESIEKWSEFYKIPKAYAYGIAYQETRYEGPFDWEYDHKRISSVGAVGPMQIMPATGKGLDKKATRDKLLSDIDYNVMLSMKLLRLLKDKYSDWKIVFGCYNTGRPIVNGYANEVYNHETNWIQ